MCLPISSTLSGSCKIVHAVLDVYVQLVDRLVTVSPIVVSPFKKGAGIVPGALSCRLLPLRPNQCFKATATVVIPHLIIYQCALFVVFPIDRLSSQVTRA